MIRSNLKQQIFVLVIGANPLYIVLSFSLSCFLKIYDCIASLARKNWWHIIFLNSSFIKYRKKDGEYA